MSNSGDIVYLQADLRSVAHQIGVKGLCEAIYKVAQIKADTEGTLPGKAIDVRKMRRFLDLKDDKPEEVWEVSFNLHELRMIDDYLLDQGYHGISNRPLFKRKEAFSICRNIALPKGEFNFYLTSKIIGGVENISYQDVQAMAEIMNVNEFRSMNKHVIAFTRDEVHEDKIYSHISSNNDNIFISISSPMLSFVSTHFLAQMFGIDTNRRTRGIPFYFVIKSSDRLYKEGVDNAFVQINDNLPEGTDRQLVYNNKIYDCRYDEIAYGVLSCQRTEKGVVMVVSGSQGFSTFGIAKMLCDGAFIGDLPPYKNGTNAPVLLSLVKTVRHSQDKTFNSKFDVKSTMIQPPTLRRYEDGVWKQYINNKWLGPEESDDLVL